MANNKETGKNFLLYLFIFVITFLLLLRISVEITDNLNQKVYLGQEIRIYGGINPDNLYMPGSLKVIKQTKEYISLKSTETGAWNIYNGSFKHKICRIKVIEGNYKDSFIRIRKDYSKFVFYLLLIISVLITYRVSFVILNSINKKR